MNVVFKIFNIIWNWFRNWFLDWGWVVLIFCGLGYGFYNLIESELECKELARQAAQICYSRGMVVAETDAGKACVEPKGIIIINE